MEKEQWGWGKFFKGFFDGRNYAKSIVLMVCGGIVIVVCFSTYSFIKSKFVKPQPIQTIGDNSGIIETTNKDNREGNSFSLLDIRGWFGSK